jgi:hypothetical protein
MTTSSAENRALIKGIKKRDSDYPVVLFRRLCTDANNSLNDMDEAKIFYRRWRNTVHVNDQLIFQEKNYF